MPADARLIAVPRKFPRVRRIPQTHPGNARAPSVRLRSAAFQKDQGRVRGQGTVQRPSSSVGFLADANVGGLVGHKASGATI